MRRIYLPLMGAVLLVGACASPYDGVGNTAPQIGAAMTADRVKD